MSATNGAGPERITSYHGQPILKEPIWTWEIPLYFYTGGLAGASAGLAYLAELRGNETLGRRAWAAAMAGITLSPALLTSDLGKPLRFINMLRMFKVTSPMSVGSWVLTVSGATTTVATANAWLGVFPRLSRPARALAALFGLPLSTYTAALVANTAIPVWHEARRDLPFVFGSGAALSAGAAALALTPLRHAAPARRLATAGAVLESATNELMHRRLGEHGEVYAEGQAGLSTNLARGCIAAGALLTASRARSSRAAAVAAGVLLSLGAVSARWSVFRAGFQSAADPKYVVGPQRAAVGRGRRKGASRREPRVARSERRLGSPATAPEPAPLTGD
ncbi:MAG TPA: NrfD/PsrC family molybdoenzyme membrane anchor subunit [Solirubrobacteraceae bacterium]|nr:NrfD/PsrC family molybdoenzyme membrane anchor subunit [Solirubrobacteraceae bacterium]